MHSQACWSPNPLPHWSSSPPSRDYFPSTCPRSHSPKSDIPVHGTFPYQEIIYHLAGGVVRSLCPLGFARIPLRALASFVPEAANVGAVRTPLPFPPQTS